MKQFNLEEYKKNPSRKVVTRSGKPVRIICTDRDSLFSVVFLCRCENDGDNTEHIFIAEENGKAWDSYPRLKDWDTHAASEYDLYFAPKRKSLWVFVYDAAAEFDNDGYHQYVTVSNESKERAETRMAELGGWGLTEIYWDE